MKKKLLSLASLLALVVTLCAPVSADETRYQYDFNFPYGTFSLANFRGTLRGLHQLDVMPLRPMAKFELDPMEYTADAAAQAEYSGAGVTITSDSSNEEKGDYSLKAVTDGTSNRTFGRSYATLDFSVFDSVTLWERSSTTSDTYQFYVEDGSGNASYWDITSSGSAGTWVQHTLDLSSPDSNSGTAADLSDVAEYGYRQLSASNTYYFDQIYLICGMNIVVKGTDLGSYYKNVYVGNQPLEVDAQSSPAITAPSSNPRIDILTIDSAGTLAWVTGTEASSPAVPWSSVTVNKIPIALVYCKTTMTKVLAYEDKDTDTDQGYIYADVRPFVKLGVTAFTGLTDTPSSITASQYLKGNSGGTALEFGALSQTFTGLTDTPSGYASQAGKLLAVNSGATGVEFVTNNIGKVLADSGDSTYGYLSDKVDNETIQINASDKLEVINNFLSNNYLNTGTETQAQNITWTTKDSVTIPSVPAGTYKVDFHLYVLGGGSSTYTTPTAARIRLNGTVVYTSAISNNNSSPINVSSYDGTTFYLQTFASDATNVVLDMQMQTSAGSGGNGTASCYAIVTRIN